VTIDAHDDASRTALMFGAADGRTDVVPELVRRGCVDVRDQTKHGGEPIKKQNTKGRSASRTQHGSP
jgi:hypothetical protein